MIPQPARRVRNGLVNMKSPDGRAVSFDEKDVDGAVRDGYQLMTEDDDKVETYVQDNKGIKGTLKVGLGQAADEFLGGAIELGMDNVQDRLEVKKREALKKDHEIANVIGGVAGFGANMAAGGWAVKGLTSAAKAVGAAEVATKAAKALNLTKLGAIADGETLAAKMVTRAMEGSKEAVDYALPSVLAELATGDPKGSAEVLTSSLGIGAVLGGGRALGGVAGDMLKAVNPLKGKTVGNAWGYLTERPNDLTQDLVQRAVSSGAIVSGAKAAGIDDNVTGALVLGSQGIRLGKIANKFEDRLANAGERQVAKGISTVSGEVARKEAILARLADQRAAANPLAMKKEVADVAGIMTAGDIAESRALQLKSQLNADQAAMALKDPKMTGESARKFLSTEAQKHTDDVAQYDARIANLEAKKATYAAESDRLAEHMAKMAQESAKKVLSIPTIVKQMQTPLRDKAFKATTRASLALFDSLQDSLSSTSPEQMSENIAAIPNLSQEEQVAVSAQYMAMFNFLHTEMPKGTPSTPFARGSEPSDKDKAEFIRKAQVANDPYLIIDRMQQGVLTSEETETVKYLYPQLFKTIQGEFWNAMADSKKQLPYDARLKMQMLLDVPVAARTSVYQRSFGKQEPQAVNVQPPQMATPTSTTVDGLH